MYKQILIATDGSGSSNTALAYISMLFAGRPEFTFHLVHCVKESQGALPAPIDDKNTLFPGSENDEERSAATNSCLRNARERLVRYGIPAERIKSSVIAAGSISRAIQAEAEYLLVDAVLIARKGIGFMGEMLLGSVSADLFKRCHQVPLWIIDGEVKHRDILLYVDGSSHSLMAADHLGYILSGRQNIRIFLYHCRRFFEPKIEYDHKELSPRWDEHWCKTYLMGENPTYDGPCQLLFEAGIPKSQITVLPEATKIDSSSSIINQARRHQCGTIVMGRRFPGMVRGIWGEVASKTIKHTQNMSLWIVG